MGGSDESDIVPKRRRDENRVKPRRRNISRFRLVGPNRYLGLAGLKTKATPFLRELPNFPTLDTRDRGKQRLALYV